MVSHTCIQLYSVTVLVFVDPDFVVQEDEGQIVVCVEISTGFPESGVVFTTLEVEEGTATGNYH